MAARILIWFTPTGVCTTNVGMPVSWQMGPLSSFAISTLARMISSACEDCVPGVSLPAASDIAARTSGGRLVEVWVMSSRRLVERNSINRSEMTIVAGTVKKREDKQAGVTRRDGEGVHSTR